MPKRKLPALSLPGTVALVALLVALILASTDNRHMPLVGAICAAVFLLTWALSIGRGIRANTPARRAIAAERAAEIERQRRR